jgi:hypothetical protein
MASHWRRANFALFQTAKPRYNACLGRL